MKDFFELRESKTVNLQEASTKVKTTMPDKVASSATRFGLKSKTQGGHVSISGPKGKLNDFLRAIIGRSSYGNASELSESALEENKIFFVRVGQGSDSMTVKYKGSNSREVLKLAKSRHPGDPVRLDPNQKQGQPAGALESVEEAYRKPTQAEIDADRRKDGKGKDTSSRYKNIKKKMYGNAMGGLKNESLSENIVQHPDHHKDYSSSDNRVGHHSGKLGKQSANLSQKQISQHSKAASDHDAAAKRHSDMAKKSRSSNAKHIHNSAASAHTTAAIAHSDVISHAKRGSLVRGHVNSSYRMTANANDHTSEAPKSRKKVSESTNLEEALVKVTDVEFNYRDQLPNSPKTSDLGAISGEWKQDRIALRDAVKKMGGLVTNTVAPSRGNKWVGTVTIGTRGDPSKLDDKSIQKAVKSHGIEIHSNQFRESTNLEEKYAVKYTHPTDKKSGRTTGPMSKAAADKKAAMGNRVDRVGGKYTVIPHVESAGQEYTAVPKSVELTEATIEGTFVKLAKELADQANKKLPPREYDGNSQFTGVSYPITMTGGGRNARVWTRGDGSKYRKPAKIVSDLDHSMYAKVLKDYKKLMGGTPVDMAWKFITSKGKSLGKATGELGSDKPAPAYQWNGTVFIKRGSESIDIVTPSIFRNSWVWRTVKEEGLDEATFMVTVPKGGPKGKDLSVKVDAKDKNAAVKSFRSMYKKFKNDTVDVKPMKEVAETSDAEVKRKQDFLDRLRGKPPVRDAVKKKSSTNESVQESTMSDRRVVRAMRIAKDMAGNHTGATRAIEKLKKGLSNHPKVRDALRTHNESVGSADKKPQNFRDPETGRTKVRMVSVDRDIASRKANESVELDEAVRERPFKGHDWGNKDGMLMHTGKKLRKNPKLKGGVKKLYVHHSTKLSVIAVTDDKKSVELIKGVPDGFSGRVDVFNDIATLAYHYGLKPLRPGDKHTEFTASGVKANESVEIAENYRTLATHGMGAETKNSINVGRDVDYYEPKNGDKRQGRITKVTRSGYVVKDEGNGKSHSFAFHDRAKAKEIMAKNK